MISVTPKEKLRISFHRSVSMVLTHKLINCTVNYFMYLLHMVPQKSVRNINLCSLYCLRHLIRSRPVKNRKYHDSKQKNVLIFFLIIFAHILPYLLIPQEVVPLYKANHKFILLGIQTFIS